MTTTTVSGQSFIRTLRHYLETNKNKLSTNYHNKNNNNNTSIPASLLPFNNHNNKKLAASNNGFPYMSLLAVTSSVNTSASLDNIPYMPQSSSFSLDIHYLYFLYVHFEELGLNIDHSLLGTLPATDAIVFTDHVVDDDMGKASSILSVGSVSSTMSTLSLGSGWQFWKKQNLQQEQNNKNGRTTAPTTLQEDLVIIHQHLSTLSALKLHMHVIIQSDNGQPRSGKRAIRGYEQPISQQGDVVLSLIPFDQLSFLELDHIHPRLIDGWHHFGSNLISLVIKRAGIEDANEVLNLLKINNHHNRENENGEEQGIEINKKDNYQQEQKRNRLQMLSLQDNNLTTLEKEPLQLIQSLTHLNLSSNLLIDVPSALSALYNLYSLNLSYNMISFVNGINAILGNIQELNLRGNRLTSIVGLDRLWALERLDIRNNRIEDITETNRLLSLPNLEDIWVSGNPFTENNSNYRIDIFNEFYHHQLEIRIDGTGPSFTEKLQLKSIPTHCHEHDTTPLATSLSNTPVPYFEHQCQQNNDNNNNNNSTNNNNKDNIPNENFTSSTTSSSVSPPPLQPSAIARAKSKKTKRIIRLRQDNPVPSMEDNEPTSPTSSHVLRYADLQDAVRPSLTRRKSNASRKSTTSSVHRRKKSPLPRSTSPTPPLPLSLSNSNRTQDELSNGERNNNYNVHGSNNNSKNNDNEVEEEEERNEEKGNNSDKDNQGSNGQSSRLSAQEAFRRKIELMRKEAGTGWLRVLQEMDTVKDGKIKDIPTME
ncbi:hypothetical protein BJ944DRAFT_121686 [Cunninghamella echinulata]|nr:hypothetical protein BJ944DRAFT_121686 [Cunninghamella echinulata]